jgi:hypothetical protein
MRAGLFVDAVGVRCVGLLVGSNVSRMVARRVGAG